MNAQPFVAKWVDICRKATRGKDPDRPAKELAALKNIAKVCNGDVTEFERRARLAAGLGRQPPPWPFSEKGSLTATKISSYWAELGDTFRRPNDQRNPSSKTDRLPRGLAEQKTVRDYE